MRQDFLVVDTEGSKELSEIAIFDHRGKLIYEAFTQGHPNNTYIRQNLKTLQEIATDITMLAGGIGQIASKPLVCHYAKPDAGVLKHSFQKAGIPWQLQLQPLLVKLDRYDLLVIDDLGYVKKTEAETLVLFDLISHRYERRSLLVAANQPFGQWDSIFSDSMMTVAAIDRLVHHTTIIELKAESFRKQSAISRTLSP